MTTQLSRRRFLARASALPMLASAGASLGWALSPAIAAEPVKRLGDPRLKIALNAYSFSKLLNDNIKGRGQGVSLIELVGFCAKQGFEGLDATGYFFPGYPAVPSNSYVDELKRRAADAGIGISGTGVRNNFTTADKAVRAAAVEHIKQWVEVAARLGAPIIRVFADTQMRDQTWETVSGGATRDQVEAWIADCLRQCADAGQKFGVIIGVQNHGDFLKTSTDQLRLVRRVDSKWCGPIVDTGYYKSADPYQDIAAVAPHAVNWQIKESPVGAGSDVRTDLKRLLTIIRQSGYRGYLPIETLSARGQDYDPYRAVPRLFAELRDAIAATASIEPTSASTKPVGLAEPATPASSPSPTSTKPAAPNPSPLQATPDPAGPRRNRKPPNKNKRNPPATP